MEEKQVVCVRVFLFWGFAVGSHEQHDSLWFNWACVCVCVCASSDRLGVWVCVSALLFQQANERRESRLMKRTFDWEPENQIGVKGKRRARRRRWWSCFRRKVFLSLEQIGVRKRGNKPKNTLNYLHRVFFLSPCLFWKKMLSSRPQTTLLIWLLPRHGAHLKFRLQSG